MASLSWRLHDAGMPSLLLFALLAATAALTSFLSGILGMASGVWAVAR